MKRLMACIAVVVLAAVGCTSISSSTGSTSSGNTDTNGTLRFGDTTSIDSFDPTQNTTGGAVRWLYPVFDCLIGLSPSGQLVPQLATSWKFTTPTVLELTLRNAKFQDGTPVDASAVKENLLRTKSLVGKQALADPNATLITSVRTVGSTTIDIDMSKPFPGILYDLASNLGMMISPASLNSKSLDTQPIGAGMFKVTQFTPGQQAVYTAWSGYWDPSAVKVKSLELENITNSATRLNSLLSGQLNLTFLDTSQVSEAQSEGLSIQFAKSAQVYTIFTKITQGTMMANLDIRKAILYAINRKAIVASVENGDATPTVQIYPPGSPGYDPQYPASEFDGNITEAKKLIKESGVALTPLTLYVFNRTEDQEVMQAVQSQLEAAGFTVNLLVLDPTQYSKFTSGNCCDGGGGYRRGDPDPLESLIKVYAANGVYHPGGVGTTGLSPLIGKIMTTEPGPARDQLLMQASGLTVQDPQAFPLFAENIPYASKCVTGFTPYYNAIDQYRGVGIEAGCS
jgi:peptide/nickel transport system substrate-binding protein